MVQLKNRCNNQPYVTEVHRTKTKRRDFQRAIGSKNPVVTESGLGHGRGCAGHFCDSQTIKGYEEFTEAVRVIEVEVGSEDWKNNSS